MMRQIKFRGKRLDNGEWVYGDLRQERLIYVDGWNVDPETIGQYTGLKDKNGVEIYEGDKCQMFSGEIRIVEWSDSEGWIFHGIKPLSYVNESFMVTGTIHDK